MSMPRFLSVPSVLCCTIYLKLRNTLIAALKKDITEEHGIGLMLRSLDTYLCHQEYLSGFDVSRT
jgi:hypothetical protein